MTLKEFKKLVDGAVLMFGENAKIGYWNSAGNFTESDADICMEDGHDTLMLVEDGVRFDRG